MSVNLALALVRLHQRVSILDADVFGPSIPRMLQLQNSRADINEEGFGLFLIDLRKLLPLFNHGLHAISMGNLTSEHDAVVWRGMMVVKSLQQLLFSVAWPESDFLIIDMPPGTGDTHLTISQTVKLSGAVVVTTPQDIALYDAVKGVSMFRKVNVPVCAGDDQGPDVVFRF